MTNPPRTPMRRRLVAPVVSTSVLALFLLTAAPTVATSDTTSTSTTSASSTTTVPSGTTTTVPSGTTTTEPSSSTTTTSPTTTTTTIARPLFMPWPRVGTAAVAVPQLSVIASSPSQTRVPIASLTKMMSAWVVLHQMPLTYAQGGPCETVRAQDAAVYVHDVATGQSNAKVVQGERICEGTLMRGLLVHSAGNYVELLVVMMHMSAAKFIATMNQDARALGLTRTHYVDYTGISPGDLSTARDQATMAIDLMSAEPIVRGIVALSHVALPVAGVVASYTPLVGEDGVVGVKSGFTNPAGGCDVMAVQVTLGSDVVTLYAVVLGQHGDDPLGLAGQAALALARALRTSMVLVNTTVGRQVRWVGWPGYVVVPPTTTTTTTTTTTSSTSTTTTVASTTTTTIP